MSQQDEKTIPDTMDIMLQLNTTETATFMKALVAYMQANVRNPENREDLCTLMDISHKVNNLITIKE